MDFVEWMGATRPNMQGEVDTVGKITSAEAESVRLVKEGVDYLYRDQFTVVLLLLQQRGSVSLFVEVRLLTGTPTSCHPSRLPVEPRDHLGGNQANKAQCFGLAMQDGDRPDNVVIRGSAVTAKTSMILIYY